MKFIIHSKQLLNEALEYESKSGERCYIPGRDTPQTNGDEILPINLEAMRNCDDEIPVFWDGGSKGTLFDMGMAYALEKPIKVIKTKKHHWTKFVAKREGKYLIE